MTWCCAKGINRWHSFKTRLVNQSCRRDIHLCVMCIRRIASWKREILCYFSWKSEWVLIRRMCCATTSCLSCWHITLKFTVLCIWLSFQYSQSRNIYKFFCWFPPCFTLKNHHAEKMLDTQTHTHVILYVPAVSGRLELKQINGARNVKHLYLHCADRILKEMAE